MCYVDDSFVMWLLGIDYGLVKSGCVYGADVGCDGVVDILELLDYIDLWLAGEVSIGDILSAVSAWMS